MKYRSIRYKFLLSSFLVAFGMSTAYADAACDTEVTAIQAVLNTPDPTTSAGDLVNAQQLFKVLLVDCNGGTPFDVVAPIAQQIRDLLGIGGV